MSDGNPTLCHRITKSTFMPAPPVGVAVSTPSAFALSGWFPTILRKAALSASDTLSEATPQSNSPPDICSPPRVTSSGLMTVLQGGIPTPAAAGVASSQPPTTILYMQYRISIESLGKAPIGVFAFRLARVTSIFAPGIQFTGVFDARPVPKSLRLSCGCRNTRQNFFRRTVIVDRRLLGGLKFKPSLALSKLSLTFQHRAGVSRAPSPSGFA